MATGRGCRISRVRFLMSNIRSIIGEAMNNRLPYLREKTTQLTTSPGVYLMKDEKGGIIYIGKAKNLKNRVSS